MTRRLEIVLGHVFFGLGFGFLAVAVWSTFAPTPSSGERLADLVVVTTFGMAAAGGVMGFVAAREVSARQPAQARYGIARTVLYLLGPVLVTALAVVILQFPPQ